jgi:hypothetical protein
MARQSRLARETLAQWEAEDRAVEYLGRLPREVRAAVAANAAKRLLSRWDEILEDLIDRGDPRKVFISSPGQSKNLHAELDRIIARRSPSDLVAEDHVIALLKHLYPDDAAWVAIKVARYEENCQGGYWHGERSQQQGDCK